MLNQPMAAAADSSVSPVSYFLFEIGNESIIVIRSDEFALP